MFPTPFMQMIGSLDGGGISYARREYEETEALPEETKLTSFTIVVEDVNHAQV